MKVLIISHNAINDSENNGRTIGSLFAKFESKDLCQLFFHKGTPSFERCNSFYQITDYDILYSLTKLQKPGKSISKEECNLNERPRESDSAYGKMSEKTPVIRFFRDLAWSLGTWKTKKLKMWLMQESPDVIFFYASDATFSHKVAHWVKKYLHIPMVSYFVDDFYLKLRKNWNPIHDINIFTFRRVFKKSVSISTNACITEDMSDEYSKTFRKMFSTIYTATFLKPCSKREITKPLILSYFGNISLGRYENLVEIGKAIHDYDLPMVLNVYSGEKRQYILDEIINKEGVSFHGAIPYSDVIDVIDRSDAVLCVESFAKRFIDYCRFSFSTKIADCLISNRCLICYAPPELASTKYLLNNKCAVVIDDKNNLAKILKKICEDYSYLEETTSRALLIADRNHNIENNNIMLLDLLTDALSSVNGNYN